MVAELHSSASADAAQKDFGTRFQAGDLTQAKLPTVSISTLPSAAGAIDYLTALNLASSNSEARRQISQGSVSIHGVKITNPKEKLKLKKGDIIKVGRDAKKIV
jgi:tyrosyl-tRNA synthetase